VFLQTAQDGLILTEDHLRALERAREEKQAYDEIETEHPGYLGSQDTYYVGNIKGVGRIYQQIYIDTYCKTALVKLYDHKHAITAADMLNWIGYIRQPSQSPPPLEALFVRFSCGSKSPNQAA
jgi:hypothetical protein